MVNFNPTQWMIFFWLESTYSNLLNKKYLIIWKNNGILYATRAYRSYYIIWNFFKWKISLNEWNSEICRPSSHKKRIFKIQTNPKQSLPLLQISMRMPIKDILTNDTVTNVCADCRDLCEFLRFLWSGTTGWKIYRA